MKLELSKLIEKMDPLSKSDLENAGYRCVARGGNEVLIEDVLYVMLESGTSVLNALLDQYDIDPKKMQEALEHGVKIGSSESVSPVLSPLLIEWIENAYLVSHSTLEVLEISEISLILALFENA